MNGSEQSEHTERYGEEQQGGGKATKKEAVTGEKCVTLLAACAGNGQTRGEWKNNVLHLITS